VAGCFKIFSMSASVIDGCSRPECCTGAILLAGDWIRSCEFQRRSPVGV
jgi:hypothetical protein